MNFLSIHFLNVHYFPLFQLQILNQTIWCKLFISVLYNKIMLEQIRLKEFPKDVQQLEHLIEELQQKQAHHERSGKYQEAEGYKLDATKGKQLLESRRLYEMSMRQSDEKKQLDNAHMEELKEFNGFWNAKQNEQTQDGKKALQEMHQRHKQQIRETIKHLEATLPSRVKESVQLLNLRKMEEHMSKQKRYLEAHQVQARIADLLNSQTGEWERNRNIKIQTKVSQLQDKHNLQVTALEKKIATSLDELRLNRHKESERLELKYINIKEDQRATQEKEQLSFKGEFKSKTSISTSGSRSRN